MSNNINQAAKASAQEVPTAMKAAASVVGDLANQASAQVSALASQAASSVSKQADDLTASAGTRIRELGDRFAKDAPDSGLLGNASQAVARTVRESGEYLETAKFSGMADGLADLIRQRPLPSVFIAAAVGWFLASKLKGR